MAIVALLVIVAAVILLLGVNYVVPWLFRWYQVSQWRQKSGQIALTYDDGPDDLTSVALLDLLDDLEVRATFYLVGFRAELCPEVVSRLGQSGHQLGSHSHNHLHPWKVPPWVEVEDAARGIETLEKWLPDAAAYRPPFGKVTLVTMFMLWARGNRVHWWSFDAKDTDEHHPDPKEMAERIVCSGHPVVLMHCHHPEPHKRKYMLALTRALIEQAKSRNMRLVTMDELEARH